MKGKKKAGDETLAKLIMCGPITIWTILFIAFPAGLLLFMSVLTKGPLGAIEYRFTLQNYADIANPMYGKVLLDSLVIAFWTTFFTVLLGYPFAVVLAKLKKRTTSALTVAIMLPLWVSGLVILYSFVIMLNHSGPVNSFLVAIGLTREPVQLLYNRFAVIIGMIYF